MEETQTLIDMGIDLNYRLHGNTPLFLAILKEQYDIAHILATAGADVSKPEKFRWLRQPIHLIANIGRLDLMCKLIQCGASIHAADASLMTPLHWAAYAGHLDVVDFLLENGAHVNVKDDCGRTPLFRAVEGNSIDIVRILHESGGSVNLCDKFGWPSLFHSIVCGHLEMILELLSYTMDIYARDNKGNTAVHLAVNRTSAEHLLVLCRTSVSFYMRERRVPTAAVHQAVQKADCSLEIIQLLIDYGYPINVKNVYGISPFMIAAEIGKRNMLHLMISAGSNLALEPWIVDQHWPDAIVTDSHFCDYLFAVAQTQVQSLLELCRHAIRTALRPNISSKINFLPLPKKLHEYLYVTIKPEDNRSV